MHEHVDLELPLSPRYATTVRAVATSLSAIVGLSVDDIDDLRLGVNEALSILTDVDDEAIGDDARLRVRFDVGTDEVSVRVSRHGLDGSEDPPELDPLARRILDAVVDEVSIDESGAVSLRKRVRADAGT